MILAAQLIVIAVVVVALALLVRHWPYPSPLIRPILPPLHRWPEAQIRGWVKSGRFHPGYLAFFDRDPERIVPVGTALLAPADGLVTSIECRAGIRYIVIALSLWDMHVQRSPVAGRVTAVDRLGVAYTNGDRDQFTFLREKHAPVQTRIVLDCGIGVVAVRQITSLAARRIETWVSPGAEIERGQRIGRIRLGSTVVLEVPAVLPCRVHPGARVRAGESALVGTLRADV